MRAPRAGGAVTTLAAIDEATIIASDATTLYLTADHTVGAPTADGKQMSGVGLYALPLAGGEARLLVDNGFSMVGVSDGATLSWDGLGRVNQVPIAGGPTTSSMLTLGATITAMAAGRDALFLAMYEIGIGSAPSAGIDPEGGSSVASAKLDGSDLKTLAHVEAASSIAVDAHGVYVTTGDAVVKIDKASGATTTVVTGLQSPSNVVLHAGNVYWANATVVATSAVDPPYGVMTACK